MEQSNLRAEINVTPLVDVCLVLLIIFMVVTPLLDRSSVALPRTAAPPPFPATARQLVITLDAVGGLSLAGRRLAAAEASGALAAAWRREPDRSVVLRADRALPYRTVRQAMRTVEQAGFGRLGLIVTRRDGHAAPASD